VSTDDILDFMAKFTEGRKPQTKRSRFSHLTAFFNFMRNIFDCDFKNPCDSPMLRKLFRPKANVHWDNIEKETVDEIIFRTNNLRHRLMLELMARGGMRVGEVLKLTPADILDWKLILNDTKNGMMSGSAKAASDSRGASVAPDFVAIPSDLLRWLYEQYVKGVKA